MSIDTKSLSRSLNSTTTSYKYLFLMGLLELIKASNFEKSIFSFKDLGSMMLAKAWYSKKYFRLSFGKQDQIGRLIDELDIPIKLIPLDKIFKEIHSIKSIDHTEILRYVPQRILREFFSIELRGLKDQAIDAAIISLSTERFNSDFPPIYRINTINQHIEVSGEWLDYIKANYIFLSGWALGEWGGFLQKNNPNSPGILNKTTTPIIRESLKKQRCYWNSVIASTSIRCIYTNELIDADHFHLDHLLPWSFVAHNQLWNLIPTSPAINLTKNDSIPDPSFVTTASSLHHKALITSQHNFSEQVWRKDADQYLMGLSVKTYELLLDANLLEERFQQTYFPLIDIAINSGFSGSWRPQP